MFNTRLAAQLAALAVFIAGCSSAAVSITITSNPTGQVFTVGGNGCNGGGYTAPQTLSWTPGSSCTVSFVSPHSVQVGTQYTFSIWQDGVTTNPRVIVAPSQPATYSGNFTTQYFLTTAANPPAGGTMSGGGWYNANSTAMLTASPAGGYRLVDWNPPSIASPGATSATVTVNFPQIVIADFAPLTGGPPVNYTVSQIATSAQASSSGRPINNFGQVVGSAFGAVYSAFLWTPTTANGSVGNVINLGGLPISATPSNAANGINDHGEVVGTTSAQSYSAGQAFLWAPATTNGTTGSLTAFLGSAAGTSSALGINSFGQIAGNQNSNAFLWTPTTANGVTGTTNSDSRLIGLAGINDFGQAISTSNFPSQSVLFTPTVANGGSGSFTQITGLAGSDRTQLQAINNSGTIMGTSCMIYTTGLCHGFLWTPTSANGTVGVASEIPLPAGFVSMTPMALNNGGQVVGIMVQSTGAATPFLYTGGKVYDLTTVSGQLQGGTPVGINDGGQIVVNVSGSVYLLTPILVQPPGPTGMDPGSGSGSGRTMTFTFSDPRGWQDLYVVNVLINNFLDGRQACYLAYVVSPGFLLLVDDAGDAGGPFAGSQNSQCAASLASVIK